MPNAEAFWGEAHATPATCRTTVGTGTQTCDGDGDGIIGVPAGSNERLRFWQHLANAGLVEGTYTGVGIGASEVFQTGTNIPSSKLNNASWGSVYRNITGNANFYDGDHGNTLQIGSDTTTGTNFDPVITPEEAWNIDKKIDDGLPGKGRVMAVHWDDCGGASAEDDYDTEYVLTATSTECALMFPHLLR